MTLSEGKESMVQIPLVLPRQEKSPAPHEESQITTEIYTHSQNVAPTEDSVVNETTVVPDSDSQRYTDIDRLRTLEEKFEREDRAGSQPPILTTGELQKLAAKVATEADTVKPKTDVQPDSNGYSLEKRIFAPKSVYMNLDPIDITPDGHPVYAWIDGDQGREFRSEGVIMKKPDWLIKLEKKKEKKKR